MAISCAALMKMIIEATLIQMQETQWQVLKKSEAVPFRFVAMKQSDDGTQTQDILRWKGEKHN